MNSQDKPLTAFVLSLTGGILMLVSGWISSMWFMFGGLGMGGMMSEFEGMMEGYQSMMGKFGVPFGLMIGLSLLGLVSGVIVTISALMLNVRSAEHTTWGAVILVFSVISFLGMGGFFIGAILGIIGGVLALTWKTASKS